MNDIIFPLSDKYLDFLACEATVEFLEGTTSAGKTTVAVLKFMFKVARSPKKLHIISGLDLGTIEKNIIHKELGLIEMFGDVIEYRGDGDRDYKMPHIKYHTDNGTKIILVLGYDNEARWKKALGGQYGCVYIDEFNVANINYIREVSIRYDYLLTTLNPDDESLPCYNEYVNHARPMDQYKADVPNEIMKSLLKVDAKKDWVYWFFSFDDNLGISEDKKKQIKDSVAPGTKLHKNKIQGLRGRATGLVFSNFSRHKQVITIDEAKQFTYTHFSCGVDTSYSRKSKDTISFIFMGFTACRKVVILDEEVYNNKDLETPIAPSDTIQNLVAFLERNRQDWGFARYVFIDNADQATIMEAQKYKRNHACIYEFEDAWKELKIIDRIHFMINWLHNACYLVINHCVEHIKELETYSWKEDIYEPEDRNDHTINASEYGWIPLKEKVGD